LGLNDVILKPMVRYGKIDICFHDSRKQTVMVPFNSRSHTSIMWPASSEPTV